MPPDSLLVYLTVIAAGVTAAVREIQRQRARRRKRKARKRVPYQDFLN